MNKQKILKFLGWATVIATALSQLIEKLPF